LALFSGFFFVGGRSLSSRVCVDQLFSLLLVGAASLTAARACSLAPSRALLLRRVSCAALPAFGELGEPASSSQLARITSREARRGSTVDVRRLRCDVAAVDASAPKTTQAADA
jgi:hypothetical protein